MGFVVAGQSAVMHQPAEGPLDDPASRDHLEAFDARGALDDFHVDAKAEPCSMRSFHREVAGRGSGVSP